MDTQRIYITILSCMLIAGTMTGHVNAKAEIRQTNEVAAVDKEQRAPVVKDMRVINEGRMVACMQTGVVDAQ